MTSSTLARTTTDQIAPEAEANWNSPFWLGRSSPNDIWTAAAFAMDVERVHGSVPDPDALEATDSDFVSNEEGEFAQVEDDPGDEVTGVGESLTEEPPKVVGEVKFVAGQTCVSLGLPSNGWLINGVPLNDTPYLISQKSTRYGTPELVQAIQDATEVVNRKYPGSPKVVVRDLSAKTGGSLKPHLSHQSGRDVDIGYYMKDRQLDRFVDATPSTLDAARTWELIASFLEGGKTQYIFIDYSLQKPLYEYASNVVGLNATQLNRIFSYPRGKRLGIIRDAKGHKNHLHVRIYAPMATAAVKDYVRKYGNSALKPLPVYYTVKRGDNPNKIAKKQKVKLSDLQNWNNWTTGKKKKPKKVTLKPGQKIIVGYKRPTLPGM